MTATAHCSRCDQVADALGSPELDRARRLLMAESPGDALLCSACVRTLCRLADRVARWSRQTFKSDPADDALIDRMIASRANPVGSRRLPRR